MNIIPQYQTNTQKVHLVHRVTARGDREEYKSVFPHEQFSSSFEARVFLCEHGLLTRKPTRRHHIDHERGVF